jgi:hypothetical protein
MRPVLRRLLHAFLEVFAMFAFMVMQVFATLLAPIWIPVLWYQINRACEDTGCPCCSAMSDEEEAITSRT